MKNDKDNCLATVFTGSYIDSLFISYYLNKAGINAFSANAIKGVDGYISHNIFPGTSILVEKSDKKSAVSLINKYYEDKQN